MQRFKITAIEEGGLERVKVINLRTESSEMLFRDWVDHVILFDDLSEPVKAFFSEESNQELLPGEWVEVYQYLLTVIERFSDCSLSDLKDVSGESHHDALNTLLAMYSLILQGLSYTPKERSKFTFKGRTFYLPAKVVQQYGETLVDDYGQSLSVGQVIEAFQRSHIYSMVDEGGEAMKDRRYHTDLAVVASIAREKKDGKIEEPPLGITEYSNFVSRRMDFFAELPMTMAMDACFFLTNSLRRCFADPYVASAFQERNPSSPEEAKAIARGRKKARRWGWYGMLFSLIEMGLYGGGGEDRIHATQRANFMEAMTVYAYRKDMNE